ncbi:3'-5' exonuclease [Herbiconiux daphne]|uniref:3'-5' exonuclease n=1 Tax=Herbiconiux daphne TaxID=2970914 RepID=A0ABT2H0P4_9MICO|nr:3'-5' exonuclease [Herbiconiux daphne]MCS5733494.1 3'-5' exonuclease [Herbiconiux daphne]
MTPPGFATIDFETSGLAPSRGARALEIAVVHSDADGVVTGRWDTLIRGDGPVGRSDIHRISRSALAHAPTFAEIAPLLLELLRGRVVVAHNAGFDIRFLVAELDLIGYRFTSPLVSLCTQRLARTYLPGMRRSLSHLCEVIGIDLDGAHRASVDAFATAQLLECYLANSADRSGFSELLERAAAAPLVPLATAGRAWYPRELARDDSRWPAFAEYP